MPKLHPTKSRVNATAFIDYKPAELRIGKQWLIVFYCKNPVTGDLDRERVTVPKCRSISEMKKLGKKMVLDINDKLADGWNPFFENSASSLYKTFAFCCAKYFEVCQRKVDDGTLRPDTLRTYLSFYEMILSYIEEKEIQLDLIIEFNQTFVVNYLDWIYFDRQNKARTHNNHLGWIGTFVKYCVKRGWLKDDFTVKISRQKEDPKIRQVLPIEVKAAVKLLEHKSFPFFVLCMLTYYCLIRRTELTKLKVSDIFLFKDYIYMDHTISKNERDEIVTIPAEYKWILAQHISQANKHDYLFSANGFKPGPVQLKPKKVSDTWAVFRKQNSIPSIYQFYSLKDSGITDLLDSGVPSIKVRDHARHRDLKETEKYYGSKSKKGDVVLQNSGLRF